MKSINYNHYIFLQRLVGLDDVEFGNGSDQRQEDSNEFEYQADNRCHTVIITLAAILTLVSFSACIVLTINPKENPEMTIACVLGFLALFMAFTIGMIYYQRRQSGSGENLDFTYTVYALPPPF